MKRHVFKDLQFWKTSLSRKPLILKGARQVGKTYLIKRFGALEYDHVAYFNFEHSPYLRALFSGSLKPQDIIKVLSIEQSIDIQPEKTLIIFDEIQECPEALNSLKYFHETANEYHLCAAGSLLGVTLANSKGFPVGKVDFMTLYPLSFNEFLQAKGDISLYQYLCDLTKVEAIPGPLHEKTMRLFKEYIFTGGMPEAVVEYLAHADFNQVRTVQQNILEAYRLDFMQHIPKNSIMKINQV